MSTIAEQFSTRLGDDGQNWETDDGISFDDLVKQMDAEATFSAREYNDNVDLVFVDGFQGGYISRDPIRYEFSDGSAIVAAGEGWDIEGSVRYSWAGA